ncbi:hypothetical protein HK099_006194 [Clydaea vesicula]|uniref:Transmembrane 9 superfamily member n=1 Tax=Clydaea vesicula TaxID=447962 RepID=A0AAD5U838_9FUNG|nr:hypothetical protein HK099_006194 [Clydaea vesicula]KAJ3395968.1 hypothetical protein HDU92_004465 [Lobulomyces angularis]
MKLFQTLILLLTFSAISANEHNHHYNTNEQVVVWVDTVGPFANSQETYEFTQLPYCLGEKTLLDHHHETLGEALLGVELINLGTNIQFAKNEEKEILCKTTLSNSDIKTFIYAIRNNYWHQLYVDDLTAWVFVGEEDEPLSNNDNINNVEERKQYLYTMKNFSISYNGDQIIEVNVTNLNPVHLKPDADEMHITFTYSVYWTKTDKLFSNRWAKYLDSDFFEHKIHWFSILNSFMMVIFLVGLVAVIMLRAISRDYARYDKEEGLLDLDRDLGDEYGWKQVHGDVFRSPSRLTWISAMVGTGTQLVVLSFIIILYTIMGDLYLERATILTATIFLYAVTSMISGYFGGSYYAKYGGKNWIKTMFITSGLWPGVVSGVVFSINFIAIYKTSSKAIPFFTMVAILAIWLFLIFPLTLLGAIIGRNWAGEPNFPCRVNPIPRPVPDKIWYAEPIMIILLAGILPFGSIFIETYFIFTSFWAPNKTYYVYGFMLLVFIILITVTACVSIVSTYFLLNSEDHRWHWTSFFASGSTGGYVFLYAIYYFFARTKMTGVFQTTWYFGYMGLVCFGMFIMLGTVGHLTAEKFIRKIYSNVKID